MELASGILLDKALQSMILKISGWVGQLKYIRIPSKHRQSFQKCLVHVHFPPAPAWLALASHVQSHQPGWSIRSVAITMQTLQNQKYHCNIYWAKAPMGFVSASPARFHLGLFGKKGVHVSMMLLLGFWIQGCIEENLTRTHAPGWQTWSQPKPSICLNGSPSPREDDQADHSPGTKAVGHSLEYPQAQYQTDFHF